MSNKQNKKPSSDYVDELVTKLKAVEFLIAQTDSDYISKYALAAIVYGSLR